VEVGDGKKGSSLEKRGTELAETASMMMCSMEAASLVQWARREKLDLGKAKNGGAR
jgi:hypothetical protein